MSLFEYLGVLISVVMGLGITHLLIGASRVVHHRSTVRTYWVHGVWTINILLYIVTIWWGMFWWSTLEEWHFYQFLFIVGYAVVLFLLASILYPWEHNEAIDFKAHFYRNRGWFFGIQALAWTIDIPETLMKQQTGLREAPVLYLVFAGSMIVLSLIGARTDNRNFHEFFAVWWLVAVFGYLSATTLAEIAA